MRARGANTRSHDLAGLGGPAAQSASRLLEEIATLYDLPRTPAVLRAWIERG